MGKTNVLSVLSRPWTSYGHKPDGGKVWNHRRIRSLIFTRTERFSIYCSVPQFEHFGGHNVPCTLIVCFVLVVIILLCCNWLSLLFHFCVLCLLARLCFRCRIWFRPEATYIMSYVSFAGCTSSNASFQSSCCRRADLLDCQKNSRRITEGLILNSVSLFLLKVMHSIRALREKPKFFDEHFPRPFVSCC